MDVETEHPPTRSGEGLILSEFADHLQPLDVTRMRPAPFRGIGSEIIRGFSLVYLRLTGWTIRGCWPNVAKAVLLAAPHTSNWDGMIMVATAGALRVKLRWMGKKSLTQGPFGWLVKRAGCVPIDRSGKRDLVATTRDAFAAEPTMILAISPEGTRTLVPIWKSGFYHIAVGAGVPIIVSVLDYSTHTVSLPAMMMPSGDYAGDLRQLQSCYQNAQGKHPDQFAIAG